MRSHPVFNGDKIRERMQGVLHDHMVDLPRDTYEWSKQQFDSLVDELTFVGLLALAEDEMRKYVQRNQGCSDDVDDDGLQIPF